MNNRVVLTIIIIIIIIFGFYIIGNFELFVTVNGHAYPMAYKPQPYQIINSTITIIPDEVSITFNERPELVASTIKVSDFNDTRIDNNDLKLVNSEKELTISLNKSKLISGVYFVEWFVLSKDDGLITRGTYSFSFIPT
jgi:methionine-rich copper-binding protein CopC